MTKAARQSFSVSSAVSGGGADASLRYTQPQSSDKLYIEQKLSFTRLVA